MKRMVIGAAVVVAALLVGGAVGSQLDLIEPGGSQIAARSSNPTAVQPESGRAGRAGGATGAAASSDTSTVGVLPPSSNTPPTGDTAAFARSATLYLTSKDVGAAQAKVDAALRGAGGIVLRASQDPESYTVTVRVPADKLDALATDLRSVGRLEEYSANASDESGTIADTDARLRNAQAREAALLGLLAEAKSASESAQLQQQLAAARNEVEAIAASRRATQLLIDTATLTVTVSSTPLIGGEPEPEPMLARAWDAAVRLALIVTGGLLVVTAGLLPIVALVLGFVLAIRTAIRRRRRAPGTHLPGPDGPMTPSAA